VLLGGVASFLGNLILARILSPSDFGVYAFAASVVAVVFLLGGFGSQEAIVQCRDVGVPGLIPTALLISGLLAVALGVVASLAGLLVAHRHEPTTGYAIVALAWTSATNSIGYAYAAILQRGMRFRVMGAITVCATVVSFTAAILLAESGWTVSALVFREVVYGVVVTSAYVVASHYRDLWAYHRQAAKWIWDFGWRLLVQRFGEVMFGRVDSLAIAGFMGARPLGYYSLAYRLGLMGNQLSQGAIHLVFFSTFAALQYDRARLTRAFSSGAYWVIRISCLLGLLTWFLGSDAVVILYGTKWAPAGELLRVLAVFLALLPLHETARVFLMGSGGVAATVRVRVIQVAAFVPAVLFAARWGTLVTVAWTVNAAVLLSLVLFVQEVRRRMDLQWSRLAIAPLIATASVIGAGLLTRHIHLLDLVPVARLAAGMCVVSGVYIGLLLLTERMVLLAEIAQLRRHLAHAE
jgi:PST family polysaccharide transporter